MIQPGMMFGGEGPVMQGTWYNPVTGDAFTVRDSFFEDNQYVVTTTDGRYLRYDQIQNYIQSDMKLEDLKQLKKEKDIKNEQLPAEVSNLIETDEDIYFGGNVNDMLLPEDAALINKPVNRDLGNIYNTPVQDTKLPVINNVSMNVAIIEKALKNTVKPDFGINVKWDNYPSKEIEMLKDIMDIPEDEIVDWYLDNIQLEDFIIVFKNAIKERLFKDNNKLSEDTNVKTSDTIKGDISNSTIDESTELTIVKPTRARNKDKKDKKTTKK